MHLMSRFSWQHKAALNPNITNGNLDPVNIFSSQGYDYQALYNLGHCCNPLNLAGGSPPSSSIAIATFGGFDPADIKGFTDQYNLAYYWVSIGINGTPACPAGQAAPCPNAETTLDMEWAIATANSFGSGYQTAKVFVYISGANTTAGQLSMYNKMLTDGNAKVFSTSWGCAELWSCASVDTTPVDAVFKEMVGQGWTLIAASGDGGAADDCRPQHHPAHHQPAVAHLGRFPRQRSIRAVDGRHFTAAKMPWATLFPNPGWQGGTAAGSCAANNGGSGGGVSRYFDVPKYQEGMGGAKRMTPGYRAQRRRKRRPV
jgi:subtilase family serine protease